MGVNRYHTVTTMALHELSQKELEKKIKEAKATEGVRKIADGESLYLVKRANGGLSWQLDFSLAGKRKTFSIGTYPKVTLSTARALAQEARELVQRGKDPVAHRKGTRQAEEGVVNVAAILQDWTTHSGVSWSPRHRENLQQAMDRNILPEIGMKPVFSVTTEDLRALLTKVEARGAHYMLARVHSILERGFERAVNLNLIESNPVAKVKLNTFTRHQDGHHPALTLPRDVQSLLLKMDAEPTSVPMMALRFNALVFVRPQNLRSAEWAHINLDEAVWEVSHHLMKKEREFLVPLSRQAVELLRNWKTVTGRGKLVFPGAKSGKTLSENTLGDNIHRMGFRGRHSTHGFRAMAKTLLEEGGFDSKYTKKQLAHDIDDKTERAYNRAEYWDIRVEMMQLWADYLDALRLEVHQPWRWFSEQRLERSRQQSRS